MFQTIFKRYEKKYLLNEKQYFAVLETLKSNALPDKYSKSTVCSIYYDTPDKRLIRASVEKPIYKEKLRLRSYGGLKRKREYVRRSTACKRTYKQRKRRV